MRMRLTRSLGLQVVVCFVLCISEHLHRQLLQLARISEIYLRWVSWTKARDRSRHQNQMRGQVHLFVVGEAMKEGMNAKETKARRNRKE